MLSLLLGIGLACAADTGYRTQYDYTGHGDDWYGSPGVPQQRRDFPAPFIDLILSGEDFCRGYDPWFDPLGLGAPLVRTQTAHSDYDFHFGDADPSMPCIAGAVPSGVDCDDRNPCTSDFYDPATGQCVNTPIADGNSCSDGEFCNGLETCRGGICGGATPPSCDDGNPCTLDSCDRGANACAHDLPPPPAEAANLHLAPAVPGNPFILLDWDPVPGADFYDLYRGRTANLSDLGCLFFGLSMPAAVDDGVVPPPGGLLYMLVTASSCGVQSTLGSGAFGERLAASTCP